MKGSISVYFPQGEDYSVTVDGQNVMENELVKEHKGGTSASFSFESSFRIDKVNKNPYPSRTDEGLGGGSSE